MNGAVSMLGRGKSLGGRIITHGRIDGYEVVMLLNNAVLAGQELYPSSVPFKPLLLHHLY